MNVLALQEMKEPRESAGLALTSGITLSPLCVPTTRVLH
ncbi:hypothetical protein C8E87_8098 [Paractinoplanes brasiliensis]|uniref:Uncharacterized protein n=1 Tax=Paractinoplanes brasiliensis TaxID=52695 RepID=A0A4V6PSP5_9ACTN|nr:hypothetical protein C8E87_8098 [Actinoplanes brasiliensis]